LGHASPVSSRLLIERDGDDSKLCAFEILKRTEILVKGIVRLLAAIFIQTFETAYELRLIPKLA
jgi:hypothetical protein